MSVIDSFGLRTVTIVFHPRQEFGGTGSGGEESLFEEKTTGVGHSGEAYICCMYLCVIILYYRRNWACSTSYHYS